MKGSGSSTKLTAVRCKSPKVLDTHLHLHPNPELHSRLTRPAMPQGLVTVRGRCCFSAQDAWIRNASLRDNVLMGQPWDYARYWAIVDACALQPDLDQLVAGLPPASCSFLGSRGRDRVGPRARATGRASGWEEAKHEQRLTCTGHLCKDCCALQIDIVLIYLVAGCCVNACATLLGRATRHDQSLTGIVLSAGNSRCHCWMMANQGTHFRKISQKRKTSCSIARD